MQSLFTERAVKMANSKPKQCERILAYLRQFGSITQLEAMRDLGVMHLASRISEMQKNGYEIEKKRIKVKNRYGDTTPIVRYRLKGIF